MSEAKLILGMRIERNKSGDITLSQQVYSEQLLKRFNMHSCSPNITPLPLGLLLFVEDCLSSPTKTEEMKGIPYREALGSLMWLQVTI